MIFFVSFAHLLCRSKSSDVSITRSSVSSFCTRRRRVAPCKGVTRDDSQRRFLAQHSVAMLEQCCNYSKQCRNNVATLCCAKNRRCESSRVTSPYGNPDPESRKSEIEENLYSWALESGIQFKESGILLTIGIRNPESKFY